MEWIFIIAVVIVLALFLQGSKESTKKAGALPSRRTEPSDEGGKPKFTQRDLDGNLPWLRERWKRLEAEREAGALVTGPKWFFDTATERQLEYLSDLGLSVTDTSKGQASDMIGLMHDPEYEDLEILKHFKVPAKGMNQTRARDAVACLLADPEKAKSWEDRPASTYQREQMRFLGLRLPRGLTYRDAETMLTDEWGRLERESQEKHDRLQNEWDTIELAYGELTDDALRESEGYQGRKPTLGAVREAAQAMLQEGKAADDIDADAIAERLREGSQTSS